MVVLSTLRRISLIDEEILLLALFFRRRNRRKCRSRRQRRWGVHPINRRRKTQGAYHKLVGELLQDEEKFYKYFRTTREQFAQILHYVEKDLIRVGNSRDTIKPRERLALTLREVADEYLLCSPAIMLSSVIVGALAAAVANCRSLGVGNPEMVAPVDGVGWEHGGSTTDAIGLTGGLGDISAWNSSWETCICTKACMVGGSLFVRIAQL
ncbi:hypothetical protein HOLleu_11841 [Holothuria leucospilota]|uniref:Uncharacterized protein n=1 Tax=Holothuria leucospilota TaxID=206669 RepID=A0A9Q1HCL8_HOLLE|nr:hypothetical protein HOLleu_40268 [Holothuria leucospilota]KAJ8041115.1 hypothetical protein HOLleu_11841 [Holothuria leucospilota]